jgi:hypothetical protein
VQGDPRRVRLVDLDLGEPVQVLGRVVDAPDRRDGRRQVPSGDRLPIAPRARAQPQLHAHAVCGDLDALDERRTWQAGVVHAVQRQAPQGEQVTPGDIEVVDGQAAQRL